MAWDDLRTPPSCYCYQKPHREQVVQHLEEFCTLEDSVPALRSAPGCVSLSGIGIITLMKGSHTWRNPGTFPDRLLLHLLSPDEKPG